MEAKLEQQLTGIFHEKLFQVFLYVRKTYGSLDQGRCMEILREYVLGPQLQQLLQRYWDGQRVVTKSGKCYGRPFSMGIGVTQGDPVSPTLFNIIVDAVFQATLQEICGPQEYQQGFGWSTREHNILFYVDDGRISGQELIWVQASLTKMVRIFERIGLQTNLNNTKAIICTTGFIWGQQGAEACKKGATGEGPTFRETNRTRVRC